MAKATPQDIQQVMQQIEALLLAKDAHQKGSGQSLLSSMSTTQQAAIPTSGGEDELLVTLIVT